MDIPIFFQHLNCNYIVKSHLNKPSQPIEICSVIP